VLSVEPGNLSAWMVSPGSSLSQSALQVQLEALKVRVQYRDSPVLNLPEVLNEEL